MRSSPLLRHLSVSLRALIILALLLPRRLAANAIPIHNDLVFVDMVQNNPGDPVGWQPTKYLNPETLAELGYTGQVTTGEMAGTLAVDFASLGHRNTASNDTDSDYFPSGSPDRRWLDAYARGVHSFVDRAASAGLEPYFFVDLLVFPKSVLAVWTNATDADTGRIAWNEATHQLLSVLVRETFQAFPGVKGWIVRTGETYSYDTPYHTGNSPASPSNNTMELWVDFITFLRHEICVRHGKQFLMRQWDNWPSTAAYYRTMSDRIPPHPLLYFSIKHSYGDFTRPAQWNPTLGVGCHAQVVEVELQREYEGKGAFPNYVMDGIIDGFPEMDGKVGLSSLLDRPQLRGLWTWTRGGGWWGPYIHGNEIWIDLHARVLSSWWSANVANAPSTAGTTGFGTNRDDEVGSGGGNGYSRKTQQRRRQLLTEPQAFGKACEMLFEGCTVSNGCCNSLRKVAQGGAMSVLYGQWGTMYSAFTWMRDDRIGGLGVPSVRSHWEHVSTCSALFNASLQEKAFGAANFLVVHAEWDQGVAPFLVDRMQRDRVGATVEYGARLFAIVNAAWRAMGQGYLKEKASFGSFPGDDSPHFDPVELASAIEDYDSAWAAYRAFGLANAFAPSLYHPYYLCLGTSCNCAFDPKNAGDGGAGIDATIDSLRSKEFANDVERREAEEEGGSAIQSP